MMDGLSKFETRLNKPRTKWSKPEWRMVAHELAGVHPTETRGRKTKTDAQKYESEQNLRAAEFWRDQAIEMESVLAGDIDKLVELKSTPLVDGVVRMLIKRKNKRGLYAATNTVIGETVNRLDNTPDLSEKDKEQVNKIRKNKDKAADALIRAIQVMKKNRREK